MDASGRSTKEFKLTTSPPAGDVRDPVRRDAQRYQAQLVVHDGICAPHGQRSAPSCPQAIGEECDVPGAVGGDKFNEGIRPAERAVDPGLAGLPNHFQDDIVASRADNILDDRARLRPTRCWPAPSVPAWRPGPAQQSSPAKAMPGPCGTLGTWARIGHREPLRAALARCRPDT